MRKSLNPKKRSPSPESSQQGKGKKIIKDNHEESKSQDLQVIKLQKVVKEPIDQEQCNSPLSIPFAMFLGWFLRCQIQGHWQFQLSCNESYDRILHKSGTPAKIILQAVAANTFLSSVPRHIVEYFDQLYSDQPYLDNEGEETLTFDDFSMEVDQSSSDQDRDYITETIHSKASLLKKLDLFNVLFPVKKLHLKPQNPNLASHDEWGEDF